MKKLWLVLAFLVGMSLPAFAQQNCVVPAGNPATPIVSTAVEASHVLKATPGCLIAVYVTPQTTAGFLLVFNSATVPADGAVTPQDCIQVPASITNYLNWAPQPPEWFSVGISVAFSTTGCFTKTGNASGFFHGLVQ